MTLNGKKFLKKLFLPLKRGMLSLVLALYALLTLAEFLMKRVIMSLVVNNLPVVEMRF